MSSPQDVLHSVCAVNEVSQSHAIFRAVSGWRHRFNRRPVRVRLVVDWDRFGSEYFYFPMSVLFYQISFLSSWCKGSVHKKPLGSVNFMIYIAHMYLVYFPANEGSFHPNSWWVSRYNQRMDYWGGSLPGSRKCECGIMGKCVDTTKWCNCDSGKELHNVLTQVWHTFSHLFWLYNGLCVYACVHAGAVAHLGSEDGIVVTLWAGRSRVWFLIGARDFSVPHNNPAGFWAHSSFSWEGIMGSFMGVKRLVYESGQSPRSSAQIKSKCSYTFALPMCLHCVHRNDLGHPFPFLKYNPISSHEDFPFPLII